MSSKYRNILTKYKDFIYDSKAEAQYAMYLDSLVKQKKIVEYHRQSRFLLTVGENGKLKDIGTYIADFVVMTKTGKNEIHEVKGRGIKTPLFRWKWKHLQAQYGDIYKLVLVEV